MLYDAQDILSDGQAITVTANSTNVVDVGPMDLGRGSPHEVEFMVTEAFTAGGAGTLTMAVYGDDAAAHSTPTILGSTGARALAELVVGARFYVGIPPGAERYLRATYAVATGPMLSGKITAWVKPRGQREDSAKQYPRAAVAAA